MIESIYPYWAVTVTANSAIGKAIVANPSIRINPRYLSDIAWNQWIEVLEPELPAMRNRLAEVDAACEATREQMAHNTGSVSFPTMLLLYVLARNLKPARIFEVGTFIGKSTLAMALACDNNGGQAEIYTCDGSNDFHVPKLSKTPIHGFSKALSTAVLQALVNKKLVVDLVHIDGRVSAADLELLEQISDEQLVIALDDFEGIEKGVANLSLLRGRQRFARHALVYPPSLPIIGKIGLFSPSTTALLVPVGAITYGNQ